MSDSARVGLVIAAAFAAAAVNSAWLPLWFADRGLTAAEIGTVLGAASLLRVVGVPGGGWLADRLGRGRLVIAGAAFVAAGAAVLLPAMQGVAALIAATGLMYVAGSLLVPLMDAATLALAAARRLEYGRTRAWGSMSYMAATAAAGALLARTGTGVVPLLLAASYGAATAGAAFLPLVPGALRGPAPAAGPASVPPPRLPLFRQPLFCWALLAAALVQGSHAAYYGFAAVHWRGAGIGNAAIGLLVAEGIVVEFGLFMWGRHLVERLGPARLTAIAASACVLRWTATAFTTDLAALAVIQVLHSATFACQHLSTMQVMRRLPPGQAGMGQTLVSALSGSLPTAILSWLVGRLYAPLGGLVFLPMAAVAATALLVVRPLARAARDQPHPA